MKNMTYSIQEVASMENESKKDFKAFVVHKMFNSPDVDSDIGFEHIHGHSEVIFQHHSFNPLCVGWEIG